VVTGPAGEVALPATASRGRLASHCNATPQARSDLRTVED